MCACGEEAYNSKDSFQGGLRVLRRTAVEATCSPSTTTTANGSGRLRSSRFARPVAPVTVGEVNNQVIRKGGETRTGEFEVVFGITLATVRISWPDKKEMQTWLRWPWAVGPSQWACQEKGVHRWAAESYHHRTPNVSSHAYHAVPCSKNTLCIM